MKSCYTKLKKVNAVREVPEFLESDYDENKIYHIGNMSIDETKGTLE